VAPDEQDGERRERRPALPGAVAARLEQTGQQLGAGLADEHARLVEDGVAERGRLDDEAGHREHDHEDRRERERRVIGHRRRTARAAIFGPGGTELPEAAPDAAESVHGAARGNRRARPAGTPLASGLP